MHSFCLSVQRLKFVQSEVNVDVFDVTAKRRPASVSALSAGDILGALNEPPYTSERANAVFVILKAAFIYHLRPR